MKVSKIWWNTISGIQPWKVGAQPTGSKDLCKWKTEVGIYSFYFFDSALQRCPFFLTPIMLFNTKTANSNAFEGQACNLKKESSAWYYSSEDEKY